MIEDRPTSGPSTGGFYGVVLPYSPDSRGPHPRQVPTILAPHPTLQRLALRFSLTIETKIFDEPRTGAQILPSFFPSSFPAIPSFPSFPPFPPFCPPPISQNVCPRILPSRAARGPPIDQVRCAATHFCRCHGRGHSCDCCRRPSCSGELHADPWCQDH